jgi:hypothetical protein
MTIQDRILDYLTHHPEGVDDDVLADALGLSQRQQANQRCRRLEQFGLVVRRHTNGKIRNFLNTAIPISSQQQRNPSSACEGQPWYWEGNVQAAVVRHLESIGYSISFAADTATKQQGKDIIAINTFGRPLWVSAKGWPKGTARTKPQTQARHWFSHALFDLTLWHGADPSATLALALPDQKTYHKFVARVRWFLVTIKASVFWVSENGQVDLQIHGADVAAAKVGG